MKLKLILVTKRYFIILFKVYSNMEKSSVLMLLLTVLAALGVYYMPQES